jgi:hypothetical protein
MQTNTWTQVDQRLHGQTKLEYVDLEWIVWFCTGEFWYHAEVSEAAAGQCGGWAVGKVQR